MQGERLLTGQHGRPGLLSLGDRCLEQHGSGAQRRLEGGFLPDGDAADPLSFVVQLRVLGRHGVDRRVDQLRHRRLSCSQDAHVANHASHQAPKHVPPTFVAGHHTVTDQERAGSSVIGHHSKRNIIAFGLSIPGTGQFARGVQDAPCRVDLVDVVDALQQGRHSFESHSGIDVLVRKLVQDGVVLFCRTGTSLELHENQVPHFEVAVLVGNRTSLDAVVGSSVVVDLRTGSARPWHPHRPVVVGLPASLNAIQRKTHIPVPNIDGLVVVEIHRDPQSRLIESVATVGDRLGEQLPREGNRPFLEVVTERKVARHLEERRVTRSLADLFDVQGAHDLLRAGRAGIRRRRFSEEIRLEGHHAGVDEQQRRIIQQ